MVGTVQKVSRDAYANIWIDIASGNEVLPIHAVLDRNSPTSITPVKQGLAVAIDCIGDGMQSGSPMLARCIIVER
ncbi:hypothetical protein P9255_20755 [Caballeronia sp. LZ019]|nr:MULTISPECIES: hypothetical protein [unclassified Caballeronia]MDR5736797.1 hypothetical protein [Caballeronia sp. LZ016]MDR5810722.1 hypothetical protein [Caballeronia sp. LZ019]